MDLATRSEEAAVLHAGDGQCGDAGGKRGRQGLRHVQHLARVRLAVALTERAAFRRLHGVHQELQRPQRLGHTHQRRQRTRPGHTAARGDSGGDHGSVGDGSAGSSHRVADASHDGGLRGRESVVAVASTVQAHAHRGTDGGLVDGGWQRVHHGSQGCQDTCGGVGVEERHQPLHAVLEGKRRVTKRRTDGGVRERDHGMRRRVHRRNLRGTQAIQRRQQHEEGARGALHRGRLHARHGLHALRGR